MSKWIMAALVAVFLCLSVGCGSTNQYVFDAGRLDYTLQDLRREYPKSKAVVQSLVESNALSVAESRRVEDVISRLDIFSDRVRVVLDTRRAADAAAQLKLVGDLVKSTSGLYLSAVEVIGPLAAAGRLTPEELTVLSGFHELVIRLYSLYEGLSEVPPGHDITPILSTALSVAKVAGQAVSIYAKARGVPL